MLPKFLAVVVASFAITFALYGVAVRRTNVSRLLFGMRTLQAKAPPRRVQAA